MVEQIQQIKSGYKQTEIGIIPEDWGLISFRDAFSFLSTASYSRADLENNGNLFYIHYGDIHTKWKYFLDLKKNSLPSISPDKLKNYSLVCEGDLIIADASEDYAGICKSVEIKNIGSKKIISGLHTFLLRSKNGVFENGFKGYINFNKLVKNQFDRLATGLKVYGVSKGNLKVVLIPYPKNPEEQKEIAQVLSGTDSLIESLNKLILKKRNIKQGVMQELLTGKKRLSGFEGEWEEKKLRNISEMFSGGTPSSKVLEYYGGEIPWISIADMTLSGKYISQTEKNLSEKGLQNSSARMFSKNTLFLAMYASIGKCCISTMDASTSQAILGIKTNLSLDMVFLYYYFLYFKESIANQGQQGTQSNLNKGMVQDLIIYLPKDPKEQEAIAKVLSDVDLEIEDLKRKRNKYQKLKIGMMQELLSGRIRLI